MRAFIENYPDVPITFNHGDLAPKNLLVDRDTTKITAVLGMYVLSHSQKRVTWDVM